MGLEIVLSKKFWWELLQAISVSLFVVAVLLGLMLALAYGGWPMVGFFLAGLYGLGLVVTSLYEIKTKTIVHASNLKQLFYLASLGIYPTS